MFEGLRDAMHVEREVTVWWYLAAAGLTLLVVAGVRRLARRQKDHP